MKPPTLLKKLQTPTTPPRNETTPLAKVAFGKVGTATLGHRVLLYGTGGIGKTTLGCKAPGPVAFCDAEDSLDILRPKLEEAGIELPALIPAANFKDLLTSLKSPGWEQFRSIVIEVTRVGEWAVAHTLATVKTKSCQNPHRLEDYGYGKGYGFVWDVFLNLLSDLDRHVRAGRNVILIAHDCIKNVPNPEGDDWIRYEPRLQDNDKASIKLRVKEWADHVLFFGYDVIAEDGKAKGSGTRTIYSAERPHCMAKSRTTDGTPIAVEDGTDVWGQIIK